MSIYEELEEAHRRAAAAGGALALALQRRSVRRDVAERCVREWREAASVLEQKILGITSSKR